MIRIGILVVCGLSFEDVLMMVGSKVCLKAKQFYFQIVKLAYIDILSIPSGLW